MSDWQIYQSEEQRIIPAMTYETMRLGEEQPLWVFKTAIVFYTSYTFIQTTSLFVIRVLGFVSFWSFLLGSIGCPDWNGLPRSVLLRPSVLGVRLRSKQTTVAPDGYALHDRGRLRRVRRFLLFWQILHQSARYHFCQSLFFLFFLYSIGGNTDSPEGLISGDWMFYVWAFGRDHQ